MFLEGLARDGKLNLDSVRQQSEVPLDEFAKSGITTRRRRVFRKRKS